MAGILDDVVSNDLVAQEWESLEGEFHHLEDTHKVYTSTVGQFTKLQSQCVKEVSHQRKRMKQLTHSLQKLEGDPSQNEFVSAMRDKIKTRRMQLDDMEDSLPRKNDLYLRIILDGINVSFINPEQRFKFKEQYEKFKTAVSALILLVAVLNLLFTYRAIDAVLHFLLVWYHCTLTIRESILVINGSRMKGWWRVVQFIRTIKAGILIVWPSGILFSEFRTQFLLYTCYTTIIQFFQCQYQQGCLYRLRSLGERHDMDITTDGFHSWMWKGLSFLLPFLYAAYAFQFYNGLTLFKLSQRPECDLWQVIVLSLIFFLLSAGNTFTTSQVVYQKLRGKLRDNIRKHLRRISANDKDNKQVVKEAMEQRRQEEGKKSI